jgi:hypothetical protein
MMSWEMCSPNPVPCPGALVVKNGSKMRVWMSPGIPGPLSEIYTITR